MKKLLIANRGEIALRIVRACREMGVASVAAYSQVDRELPHLALADETVCIGKRSYLDGRQLLAAALSRSCDAVHPGYGFLSENAEFCRQAEAAGLLFVGPTCEHIDVMGNKASARELMAAHGVPVLPGTSAALSGIAEAQRQAKDLGYPLMLKASAGGGGRGIAIAYNENDLVKAFPDLVAEAETLFADGEIYLERYLGNARHIELQVFGDGAGRVVYLGARDCSIQRKHQKLVEEAPPPGLPEQELAALASLCCRALQKLQYRNAGTLEFLFEAGAFYFIEMNTRIQVEHPVTEMCTGLDLVKLQIAQALGENPLPADDAINAVGCAIECRINAEDQDFRPAPGRVNLLRWPGGPGIRVDSHLYQGINISHEYDSMVAKIIAHGQNRSEAIARMQRAMSELQLQPGPTNRALHIAILSNPQFQAGTYTTQFLKETSIANEVD